MEEGNLRWGGKLLGMLGSPGLDKHAPLAHLTELAMFAITVGAGHVEAPSHM